MESGELSTSLDDQDEPSLADDSYTSASESNLLTMVESFQNRDSDSQQQMQDSCSDSRSLMSTSCAITKQPIRKTDLAESASSKTALDAGSESPFDRLKSSTCIEPATELKSSESVAGLQDKTESLTRSSGSEQYLMLTDSSCEETLVGSGSEENATGIACLTRSEQKQQLTSSSYVKNMLAEAMSDKSEIVEVPPRDNSPISSER